MCAGRDGVRPAVEILAPPAKRNGIQSVYLTEISHRQDEGLILLDAINLVSAKILSIPTTAVADVHETSASGGN